MIYEIVLYYLSEKNLFERMMNIVEGMTTMYDTIDELKCGWVSNYSSVLASTWMATKDASILSN